MNGVLIGFQPRNGMKHAPLIFAWNPPMKILVSVFEISSDLFNKHQLQLVAKRRPSFLCKLYLYSEVN